ncbi:MAG: hypothetical protein IJV04_01970 [Lachnospiraceae bacterium]|nr:hypothetical protein [Lachnospiraceae bacterium]
MKKGVFQAKKRDGSTVFRAAISRNGKRVSIGSYATEEEAGRAYEDALDLYEHAEVDLLALPLQDTLLSFDKCVTIINHRDHGIYIKTPIYLRKGYFSYFLKGFGELKFDNDDLFYYSSHRILAHGGHLYVNDFGMQYGILARYGIHNFAVCGRDYRFANGDDKDFRYENVIVINRYHGVRQTEIKGQIFYEAKIHLRGDHLIGRYDSDNLAAVAYNKAADLCKEIGIHKEFPRNYISEYTHEADRKAYEEIHITERLLRYLWQQ